nr:transporter substrate-binding domain-containing protein [Roseospira goensis]
MTWAPAVGLCAVLAGAITMGVRAALPVTPAAAPAATLPAARTLTVATVEGALPLSGTDAAGRLAGVHVEVARAVCDRLAVDCRFALTPPERLLDSLETGAVDMVAAELAQTPERTHRVRFAQPHARTASLLVGRADSWPETADRGFAGLRGRVVAAASGSDQAAALRGLAPAEASLVLAERHDEVVAALRRGEADAALLPLAIALTAMDAPDAGRLIPLGAPRSDAGAGGPVALAMAAGDAALATAVDDALAALRNSGRLHALVGRSPDPVAAVPRLTVSAPPARGTAAERGR